MKKCTHCGSELDDVYTRCSCGRPFVQSSDPVPPQPAIMPQATPLQKATGLSLPIQIREEKPRTGRVVLTIGTEGLTDERFRARVSIKWTEIATCSTIGTQTVSRLVRFPLSAPRHFMQMATYNLRKPIVLISLEGLDLRWQDIVACVERCVQSSGQRAALARERNMDYLKELPLEIRGRFNIFGAIGWGFWFLLGLFFLAGTATLMQERSLGAIFSGIACLTFCWFSGSRLMWMFSRLTLTKEGLSYRRYFRRISIKWADVEVRVLGVGTMVAIKGVRRSHLDLRGLDRNVLEIGQIISILKVAAQQWGEAANTAPIASMK
jgi:hypothetical protein